MVSGFGLVLSLVASSGFSFYTDGPYDSNVPRPEAILGYAVGTHHTVYADQDSVVKAIYKASPTRMKLLEYGKSTEGRTLRTFAISSPKNIARLDQIQRDLNTLANPKPSDNIKAIEARTPVLVWVNQCIHGDETASFESGMQLIYNLAA